MADEPHCENKCAHYLSNCDDVNGDGVCDQEEPTQATIITKEDGSFNYYAIGLLVVFMVGIGAGLMY
jgi:hypothetical protein